MRSNFWIIIRHLHACSLRQEPGNLLKPLVRHSLQWPDHPAHLCSICQILIDTKFYRYQYFAKSPYRYGYFAKSLYQYLYLIRDQITSQSIEIYPVSESGRKRGKCPETTMSTGKKELIAIFIASAVVSQIVERKNP